MPPPASPRPRQPRVASNGCVIDTRLLPQCAASPARLDSEAPRATTPPDVGHLGPHPWSGAQSAPWNKAAHARHPPMPDQAGHGRGPAHEYMRRQATGVRLSTDAAWSSAAARLTAFPEVLIARGYA